MAIKDQLRRRLVAGIAGALLVGSLLAGAVSVAADEDDTSGQAARDDNAVQYARDTKGTVGAVALANEPTLTINSVVVAPAANTDISTAPAKDLPVAAPNDGREDGQ